MPDGFASDPFHLTLEMRSSMRRRFLLNLARNGYAKPTHSHIRARNNERQVLDDMVTEGLLREETWQTTKDGRKSGRGRYSRTFLVATEAGAELARAAMEEDAARRAKYAP